MTLKEIEKIIDEADVVYIKVKSGLSYHLSLRGIGEKNYHKEYLESYIEKENVLFYYNRNEETGEMTLLAKVDHIDPEKKIIKKKLDDMTEEEINQVKDRFCKKNNGCDGCPFDYGNKCLANFPLWKKLIETTKNKEIEVVE